MTFDEQIRVIELKALSAEDERQVYTKLVCISFENRNGDANDRDTSYRDTTYSSSHANLGNRKVQLSPLNNMILIRSMMGRCQVNPYKDEKVRRASSVPNIPTRLPFDVIPERIKFSSAPQVNPDRDSTKED